MKLIRFIPIIAALGLAASFAIAQVEVVRGSPPITGTAPVVVTGRTVSMTPASASTSGYMNNVGGYLTVDAGILLYGGAVLIPGGIGVGGVAGRGGIKFPGATNQSICFEPTCNGELRYTSTGPQLIVDTAVTSGLQANKLTALTLGVATSGTISSTVASGSMATSILTGARMGLITGDGDYLSCDGTTCTWIGTKLSFPDDVTVNGSVIVSGSNQGIDVGTRGVRQGSNPLISPTPPTISSGFCTGVAFLTGQKGYGFRLDVGSSACAGISTGVINAGITANNGWICHASNITSPDTYTVEQTTISTTQFTLKQYDRATGAAADWVAGEDILVSCIAY